MMSEKNKSIESLIKFLDQVETKNISSTNIFEKCHLCFGKLSRTDNGIGVANLGQIFGYLLGPGPFFI